MRPGRVCGRSPQREGLPPGTQAVSRPPKLRVWPPLGRGTRSSNWLGARVSPSSRFPQGGQSCHKVGTLHAAPRAFQELSGYGGREFLAALRELRREPQGGCPRSARGGLWIFAAHPRGPGQARRCPHTLTPQAAERGQLAPVRREGSQVWSWGGARREREQKPRKFSRRATWEPPQIPGLPGGKPRGRKCGLLPGLPSPRSRGAPAPLTFLGRRGSVRLHPTHWCQMGSPGRWL